MPDTCAKCHAVHDPSKCQGHSKQNAGRQCRKPPTPGLHVCVIHGGGTKAAKAKAKRVLAEREATAELDRLGIPTTVDPLAALVGQVCEAAGNVEYLRQRVADYGDDITAPNHLGDLVPRVLVQMYDRERERLARFSKLALEAGVAERQITLAEEQGALIARVIRGVLGELGVDDERVPEITRRHLALVAAG